jgi:acyl-CoA synthetase (AMP-forming)/AMP-acid ligase II
MRPESIGLIHGGCGLSYGQLHTRTENFAAALLELDLHRGDRVGIYLEKRFETVIASFGAPAAGGVFVPMNPLLKPEQVGFIAQDCGVRVLVTSPDRYLQLKDTLQDCPELRHVVLTERAAEHPGTLDWNELLAAPPRRRAPRHRHRHRRHPLHQRQHRPAQGRGAVAPQHGGRRQERGQLPGEPCRRHPAGGLPLSFDAGFSQLTTAFHAGARVVLLNYLLPRDVLKAMEREKVTGLTAVPPLYIQLTQLEWPAGIGEHLRYFANTGGRMPRETLTSCAQRVPAAQPFLMYGLTEAFRSTYLPPGSGPPPRQHRQGDPERRDPGAARGRQRVRGRRAGELVHRGRAGRAGLLGRRREDRRALQAAAAACGGAPGWPAAARVRGVLGRQRAQGRCRGLPVLRRPARRDDQDQRATASAPPRSRRCCTPPAGGRVRGLRRRPRACSARPSRSSPRRRGRGARRRRAAGLLQAAHAGLHGAAPHRGAPGALPRNPNGKIDRSGLKKALVETP